MSHHFTRLNLTVRPSIPAPKQWGQGMVKAQAVQIAPPSFNPDKNKGRK